MRTGAAMPAQPAATVTRAAAPAAGDADADWASASEEEEDDEATLEEEDALDATAGNDRKVPFDFVIHSAKRSRIARQ